MHPAHLDDAVDRCVRFYGALMRVYPAAHRREYADLMVQLFRDQCREAFDRAGGRGLLKVCFGAVPDLAKSLVREHVYEIERRYSMKNSPISSAFRLRYFAGLLLLALSASVILTLWQPRYYASTARIAVQKDAVEPPGTRPSFSGGSTYDPYFIQTEFESIRGKEVLYRVIEELGLNARWARKSGVPGPFTTQETYAILAKSLDIRQFRSTSLFEIRVLSLDRAEAAEIANKVAEVYRDMRLDRLKIAAIRGLDELQRALAEQEQKTMVARQYVNQLRSDNKISEVIGESGSQVWGGALMMDKLEQQAADTEMAWKQANMTFDQLSQLSGADLRKILPTVQPDTLLIELLSRYSQTETEIVKLMGNYSPTHPEIVQAKSVLSKLDEQVENRVKGILGGLKFKMQALESDKRMRAELWHKAKDQDLQNARVFSEFILAKRELETQRQLQQTLALRVQQERMEANLPKTSPVEMVDRAEPGLRPIKPNWPLNIALGITLGLLAGFAMAVGRLIHRMKAPGAAGAA